ncbi:hypothetical protein [Bradyrhizobium elkanii]|uniref:hypothetical protein n=1 Tax=Bradyrhizobium elkanii TaxID=29448 RepID=UPI003D1B9D0D
MPQWLISFLTGGLNLVLGTIGKTVTDLHADNITRYKNENDAGNQLATTTADASVRSAQIRADVQKSQGTWGPFGLAGFLISMAFAFHVLMIVMDSTSWHLVPTLKWYVLPWLEWQPHVVGSWKVATLPGRFEDTEHAILQALF